MHTVLMIVHILIAITLIGLVLIQRGKGADMGAAFGSGASSTIFGSRGSASFLTRTTGVLAALFFITSLSLAFSVSKKSDVKSVVESAPVGQVAPAPQDVPQPKGTAVPGGGTPADVPVVPGK